MVYQVTLVSKSDFPNADLNIDFVIRWKISGSGEEDINTFVIMTDNSLHLARPEEKVTNIILRLNEERILKAICANPRIGNVWLDHGEEPSESSLIFTIIGAMNVSPNPMVKFYPTERWQKERAEIEKELQSYSDFRSYQGTLSSLDRNNRQRLESAKQEDRIQSIEYISDVLAVETGKPTELPEDWKKLSRPQLELLHRKLEWEYRVLLIQKIIHFGGFGDPTKSTVDLQIILDRLRH